MLVLTRKKNEKIVIADNIEVTILDLDRNRVRLGIQAPKEVKVHTKLKTSPPAAPGEKGAAAGETPEK